MWSRFTWRNFGNRAKVSDVVALAQASWWRHARCFKLYGGWTRWSFGECGMFVLHAGDWDTQKTIFQQGKCVASALLEDLATSWFALRWMCDSPRTGCARRTTPIYKWRERAVIEWSRRMISIVTCCHSVKLCALAVRAFISQQWLHQTAERKYNEICRSLLRFGHYCLF